MDEQPRGRGRPRKRPENLVRLRCDVTPEEADAVRRAAEQTGETLSDFTRRAVVEEAGRVTGTNPPAKRGRGKRS